MVPLFLSGFQFFEESGCLPLENSDPRKQGTHYCGNEPGDKTQEVVGRGDPGFDDGGQHHRSTLHHTPDVKSIGLEEPGKEKSEGGSQEGTGNADKHRFHDHGFVYMLFFCVWGYFGRLYCTAFYYVKGERGRISMKNDVTAFGEKGFAQGIK